MTQLIIKFVLTLLATSTIFLQTAAAVQIVRLEIEYGSDTDIATGGFDILKTNRVLYLELFDDVTGLDLELFDGLTDAPAPTATVANYLEYVTTSRYDDTFFTRSVPGFIVQAGGAANKPTDPDNDDIVAGVVAVEDLAPVVNEPGISNTRGTIAMARTGGQPDSATNEWFINLIDNTSLNTVDEGFTVFGRVIDDGMETADELASLPITGFFGFLGLFSVKVPNTSFADFPYADADFEVTGELFRRNLLLIKGASKIDRPILRFSPAISNFGFESITSVTAGKTIDVVLKNTGNEILDIESIGTLDIPFSLISEDCSGNALIPISVTPASLCTISLKFLPVANGKFTDDLIIEYKNQIIGSEIFTVKHPLVGEGGLPVIDVESSIDITSQVNGYSTTKDILVGNSGVASLQVTQINGLDAANFTQTNNCVGFNVFIAPGETCSISVKFETSDFSTKMTTLKVVSNDQANITTNIIISGIGDTDADGVTSVIEDAAPNVGDNNYDTVLDSLQNNIASFVSASGEYISLVVGNNYVVSNISMTSTDQLSGLPSDVEFKYGDIGYQIEAVQPGATIEVGLILPAATATAATKLTGYYFFGETADNTTPHWYPYGAVQKIIINGKLGGSQSAQDFIQLLVQDGGPGDADQIVNGRILLAHSAPAYSIDASGSSDSGSSSMNILFLGVFIAFLVVLKRRYS